MRIYAFTDTHGNTKSLAHVKQEVRKHKPDLVICTGDLSVFEHELKALLSRVNMFGPPVVMLHGNHEEEDRIRALCGQFPKITFLHKEVLQLGGWTFAAFGGGGFDDHYPELEALLKRKEWKELDWEHTIFLSHAPPHGTSLDDVGELEEAWHVGSKTLTKLVKKHKPLLVLAGHIHECFETSDTIGKTIVENPGPKGKLYDLKVLRQKKK